MLFQKNSTTPRYITIFGILVSFFLMGVFFVSCDRIQSIVVSDETATSDDAVSVKNWFHL